MRHNTAVFRWGRDDHFRGSREAIKRRLRIYLPFVRPVAATARGHQVLDLNCGRCEWLELLRESRIPARGVDLTEEMAKAGTDGGYEVTVQDALGALRASPNDSLIAVSGFHIVEYMPFAVLKAVLTEAYRSLIPGGLLLMEVPSPDLPTSGDDGLSSERMHSKLFPHRLFGLIESAGFERYTLLRLQEPPPASVDQPDWAAVFWGASLHCALVAQKAGDTNLWLMLYELFGGRWGVSLRQAVNDYSRSLQHWIASVLGAIDSEVSEQDAALAGPAQRGPKNPTALFLRSRHSPVEEAKPLPKDLVDQMNALSSRVDDVDYRLFALLDSVSWKLTAPLRFIAQWAKRTLAAFRRSISGIHSPRGEGSTSSSVLETPSRAILSQLEKDVLARLLRARAGKEGSEDPH